MLSLSPSQRILLAVNAADFRKGIDGLIGLCRRQLGENPLSGTLFVFTNRRRMSPGGYIRSPAIDALIMRAAGGKTWRWMK